MGKDYKLSFDLYAKRAFDLLTPTEQRILQEMMGDVPVLSLEKSRAARERWIARLRAKATERK